MSDENGLALSESLTIMIPPMAARDSEAPPILKGRRLPLSATKEAERRIPETKNVSLATYHDLEYTFHLAYKELKNNYAEILSAILQVEEYMGNVKAKIILETYPNFMKDKPRGADNADVRNSFVRQDPEHTRCRKWLNLLKSYEALVEGRIKFIEKVGISMNKQIAVERKTSRVVTPTWDR